MTSFSLEKRDSLAGRYLCPTFPDSPHAKRSALFHLSPQRAGMKTGWLPIWSIWHKENLVMLVSKLSINWLQQSQKQQTPRSLKNKNHTLVNTGSVCKHYFQAHWKCNPLRGKAPSIIKRWCITMHNCKRGRKRPIIREVWEVFSNTAYVQFPVQGWQNKYVDNSVTMYVFLKIAKA